MSRVLSTRNYKLFKVHEVNREIKTATPSHARLEASMLKTGWWRTDPMIVLPAGRDGMHVITKGHHRFKIAEKHGLEVFYAVDEQMVPIHEREDSTIGRSSWSLEDWITSYIKIGKNLAYQILANFKERTGLDWTTCLKLFVYGNRGKGINWAADVRSGEFRIVETQFAETVGALVLYCVALDVSYARKSNFVAALAVVVRTKVVEVEELKKRLRQNVGILKRRQPIMSTDYLGVLNEAYNFRHSPRVDFATEIENALAEERRRIAAKAGKKGGAAYRDAMARIKARDAEERRPVSARAT